MTPDRPDKPPLDEERGLEEHETKEYGAGRGNRTLVTSLEGWSFTTKLYPHRNF